MFQTIFEDRLEVKPKAGANGAEPPPKLVIRENISTHRPEIFTTVMGEKLADLIHSVYSRNGDVFCPVVPNGIKINVHNIEDIQKVMHG